MVVVEFILWVVCVEVCQFILAKHPNRLGCHRGQLLCIRWESGPAHRQGDLPQDVPTLVIPAVSEL